MKKIIVLSGHTASGKTKYSIELAKRNNLEIVNFDSLLFYKEISIGTEAQIYTLLGSKNNIELKEVKIAKPRRNSLKLLKLLTPRDKYAIRVLDNKNKEIITFNIKSTFILYLKHNN